MLQEQTSSRERSIHFKVYSSQVQKIISLKVCSFFRPDNSITIFECTDFYERFNQCLKKGWLHLIRSQFCFNAHQSQHIFVNTMLRLENEKTKWMLIPWSCQPGPWSLCELQFCELSRSLWTSSQSCNILSWASSNGYCNLLVNLLLMWQWWCRDDMTMSPPKRESEMQKPVRGSAHSWEEVVWNPLKNG